MSHLYGYCIVIIHLQVAKKSLLLGNSNKKSFFRLNSTLARSLEKHTFKVRRQSLVCVTSRQLAKVKYTHPHNHGDACHPRCKPRKQSSTTAANPTHATTPAVSRPRKRQRSESDPGKTINLTLLRIRAPRTTIIPLVKRARVQAPSVDITSLLDQTHTRRMAMLGEGQTVRR